LWNAEGVQVLTKQEEKRLIGSKQEEKNKSKARSWVLVAHLCFILSLSTTAKWDSLYQCMPTAASIGKRTFHSNTLTLTATMVKCTTIDRAVVSFVSRDVRKDEKQTIIGNLS